MKECLILSPVIAVVPRTIRIGAFSYNGTPADSVGIRCQMISSESRVVQHYSTVRESNILLQGAFQRTEVVLLVLDPTPSIIYVARSGSVING